MNLFTVRAPLCATVSVTCRGRACPIGSVDHARRSRRAPASRGAAALPRRRPAHRRRLEGRAGRKGHGVPVPQAPATAANGQLPAARSRDRSTSVQAADGRAGRLRRAGRVWRGRGSRQRGRRRRGARAGRRRLARARRAAGGAVANRSETPRARAAPPHACQAPTPPRGRGPPGGCGTTVSRARTARDTCDTDRLRAAAGRARPCGAGPSAGRATGAEAGSAAGRLPQLRLSRARPPARARAACPTP